MDPHEAAESFLKTLFHPCPVHGKLRIEIRTLRPMPNGKMESRSEWFPLHTFGIQQAAKYSVKLSQDWDVYMGVLPRIGDTRDSDSVPLAPWLFLDIDGGEEGPDGAVELYKKADLLPPHLCVKSGGGIHLYWRLDPYITFGSHEERRMFKGFLKRLVLTVGGDSPAAHADDSCTGISQILRVPGTFNRKQEQPRLVKLVRQRLDLGAYCLEAWNAILHPLPNPRPISTDIQWSFAGSVPEGIRRWAETPFPEGKRHKDLTSAGAWLHRDLSIPKHLVEELLLTKARASNGTRKISDEEVLSIVKWL